MNVRPPIEASSPTTVLSVAYNNDASCFAVGLESGICSMYSGGKRADEPKLTRPQYTTQSLACSRRPEVCLTRGPDSLIAFLAVSGLTCPADFNAGIGLVQMMGMTNYLALVGGGKSPKFAMNKVASPSLSFSLCMPVTCL